MKAGCFNDRVQEESHHKAPPPTIASVPGIMMSPLAPSRSRGTWVSVSFNYPFDKCRLVEDDGSGSRVSFGNGDRYGRKVTVGCDGFVCVKRHEIGILKVFYC